MKTTYMILAIALAYLSYRVIKEALEEPPPETRGPDPDDPVACACWDEFGDPSVCS